MIEALVVVLAILVPLPAAVCLICWLDSKGIRTGEDNSVHTG